MLSWVLPQALKEMDGVLSLIALICGQVRQPKVKVQRDGLVYCAAASLLP
jgi:hypothetical protein